MGDPEVALMSRALRPRTSTSRIARGTVVTYPFEQDGMDGIPTGAHWLEVAEELEVEAPQLAQRLRENYFTWHKHGDAVRVKGGFSYALICAERPA